MPRVGEFLKLANRKVGDYFSWEVTDVTYREGGSVEIATELLENIQDRGFSFETEEEFDEYLNSYIAEGWRCDRPVSENKRVKNQSPGGTSDA